jgi:hypothetical protein
VVCSRTHPREGTLSRKSQRLTDLGPGRKGDVTTTSTWHLWVRINCVPRLMRRSATGTRWERTPWHATQGADVGGAEERGKGTGNEPPVPCH